MWIEEGEQPKLLVTSYLNSNLSRARPIASCKTSVLLLLCRE